MLLAMVISEKVVLVPRVSNRDLTYFLQGSFSSSHFSAGEGAYGDWMINMSFLSRLKGWKTWLASGLTGETPAPSRESPPLIRVVSPDENESEQEEEVSAWGSWD